MHSVTEKRPEKLSAEPATPRRLEVRLSGSGGQGILLAATLLAGAALGGGRRVVQTQSYGPEARGGASKAEIIISDAEVNFPEVRSPDVTLCLSQAAFDKYAAEAPADSVVYYDSGLVRPSPLHGVGLHGAPFTRLASQRLGKTVVANIVALGAVASHSGLADEESLRAALVRRLPERLVELNQAALALGVGIELMRSP